ncbi:MAG: hypothetical protein ACTH7C_10555, partial [Cobetia marina]
PVRSSVDDTGRAEPRKGMLEHYPESMQPCRGHALRQAHDLPHDGRHREMLAISGQCPHSKVMLGQTPMDGRASSHPPLPDLDA